ncbi:MULTISPECIES: hypothetical protein [unclassified Leptolyngbya]
MAGIDKFELLSDPQYQDLWLVFAAIENLWYSTRIPTGASHAD